MDEYFDIELNMKIVTVALITCDANEKLGKIHHRMPVVLEKKDFNIWLNSDDIQEVNKLFEIYPNDKLQMHEVSSDVNKVLFGEPSCIDEVVKNADKEKIEEVGQLSLF